MRNKAKCAFSIHYGCHSLAAVIANIAIFSYLAKLFLSLPPAGAVGCGGCVFGDSILLILGLIGAISPFILLFISFLSLFTENR